MRMGVLLHDDGIYVNACSDVKAIICVVYTKRFQFGHIKLCDIGLLCVTSVQFYKFLFLVVLLKQN